MSEYHEREVLNAGKLGTYRVHSLFTRITSEGNMQPEIGEPFPGAVALHAHEYTHYLHNLSTLAGLDALLACFWLVTPFVRGTDDRGWFTAPVGIEKDENLSIAFSIMKSARGSVEGIPNDGLFKWPEINEWCFGTVLSSSVSLSHSTEGDIGKIGVKSISITAKHNRGEPLELVLIPGLDFISEGIAYEVEREQRRVPAVSDQLLDSQTPSYPYLAYRPLIEHLIEYKTTVQERILIGNLALLTTAPSYAFFEICAAIKRDRDRGDGATKDLDKIGSDIYEAFVKHVTNSKFSYVGQLKEVLAGSSDHIQGLEIYCKLIEKGLRLRVETPMMEQLFTQARLSPDEFRNVTLKLLERLVCQETVDGESTIEWVVPLNSIIAELPDEEIQKLSVLQTSIHFLQQHFTKDGGLGSTVNLKESACPFAGACQTQKEYGYPADCESKPWNVSVADGKQVCWYEAGRLSLRLDRRYQEVPASPAS
ncbi:hypothetical protein ACCC96_28980 [Pseudomonas sp. Pseusp11]|uniref:hypothetical protein n=1 Tax=Pseudomonas sp. Pseusp11 TaxID=3243003 RepID=UPI0039B5043C